MKAVQTRTCCQQAPASRRSSAGFVLCSERRKFRQAQVLWYPTGSFRGHDATSRQPLGVLSAHGDGTAGIQPNDDSSDGSFAASAQHASASAGAGAAERAGLALPAGERTISRSTADSIPSIINGTDQRGIAGCAGGDTVDAPDAARSRPRPSSGRPRRPPLPSSSYFLHTSHDSLPRTGLPGDPSIRSWAAAGAGGGGEEGGDGASDSAAAMAAAGVVRARRYMALAASLAQFVSKLPPASLGSPAAALRSKLGARLALPALTEWVEQVAEALEREVQNGMLMQLGQQQQRGQQLGQLAQPQVQQREDGNTVSQEAQGPAGLSSIGIYSSSRESSGSHHAPDEGTSIEEGSSGSSSGGGAPSAAQHLQPPAAPAVAVPARPVVVVVEHMLAAQPQLLAQDSQVLAARLRGLAALLHLPPRYALQLVSERPGLLLLDLPTLERRLVALAAALRLPDTAAAAAVACSQPAWLYADLTPPLPGPQSPPPSTAPDA